MDWDDFQERFRSYFISEAARAKMRRDFEGLVQGSLSVEAYEQRFTSLIRYAPQYEYDEAVKTERFLEGLRPQIRPYLRASRIRSFHELVQTAMRLEMEQGLVAPQPAHASPSEPHPGTRGRSRGRFGQRRGSGQQDGPVAVQDSRGAPSCPRCGRSHPGRPCFADIRTCYRCGSREHLVSRCPQPPPPVIGVPPQLWRQPQFQPRGGHRGGRSVGPRPVLAPAPVRVVALEQGGPSEPGRPVDQPPQQHPGNV